MAECSIRGCAQYGQAHNGPHRVEHQPPVDWDALVEAEAPAFKHLRPALMRRGFTVAAYFTEHQKHLMAGTFHSACIECLRAQR